jgi:hypothetical protein
MQVGDLVKYSYLKKVGTGIIVDFGRFNGDPIIRDNRSGLVRAPWRKNVEVINASR